MSICKPRSSNENRNSGTEEQTEETNVNVSTQGMRLFQSDSVLLETARANVSSTESNSTKTGNFRLLLDSGSQLTYISPRARKLLDLKTSDRKDVLIKTFGGHVETRTLESVKLLYSRTKWFEDLCRRLWLIKCSKIQEKLIHLVST